jgi:hypothetical protein
VVPVQNLVFLYGCDISKIATTTILGKRWDLWKNELSSFLETTDMIEPIYTWVVIGWSLTKLLFLCWSVYQDDRHRQTNFKHRTLWENE